MLASNRTASTNAALHFVSVVSSNGRSVGFDLAAKCGAVRVKDVPPGAKVTARVTGIRKDAVAGKTRTAGLRATAAASAKRTLPVRPCCS